MTNITALNSTTSSVLGDVASPPGNKTLDFSDDLTADLWRYGWPPLCMTGLVGNMLVLLVLGRDGHLRTSANVYLCALAVGDNLVLIVASVAIYPIYAWNFWIGNMSTWSCHSVLPAHHTLMSASIWIIVAFTADRYLATRFLLHKLRMRTPITAGLCCLSLFVLAFVKNVDLCVVSEFAVNSLGDEVCIISLRYMDYVLRYRHWINLVLNTALPSCVVLVCNWAIIQELRRNRMPMAVRESVTRTSLMCIGVSFAFVFCVVPIDVFFVIINYLPMTSAKRNVVIRSLIFLRYVNHVINFFLFCLTGPHFRRELGSLFCSCIQRARTAATVVRRISYRVTGVVEFRRDFGEDLEMR